MMYPNSLFLRRISQSKDAAQLERNVPPGSPLMTFSQRLAQHAKRIDQHLSALIDRHAHLETGGQARLQNAMRSALLDGGKRIRPFLVIESAALFGVKEAECLNAAAAIECVHCYSLVHDDLPAMDNDELRRGQPSLWKAYDEWTAILTGDALLTLAFELLSEPTTHPDTGVRVALVATLAKASGVLGMAGGQALDLAASKLSMPASPDVDGIRHLQSLKTGALITAACTFGALVGRADDSDRTALERYGGAVGLAFQIADDLLDHEGTQRDVGKTTGKDETAGKATLVATLGAAAARKELAMAEQEAIDALSAFGERAAALREAAHFVAARTR